MLAVITFLYILYVGLWVGLTISALIVIRVFEELEQEGLLPVVHLQIYIPRSDQLYEFD